MVPPKPIKQLKSEGTYRSDRHGQRGDEPEAIGQIIEVDFADDHHAQFCWDLLVLMAEQLGAGEIDTLSLAAACKWYSHYVAAMTLADQMPADGIKYPKTLQSAKLAWREFVEIARDYGLSPQDRIKLAKPIRQEEELDPFEALTAALSEGNGDG